MFHQILFDFLLICVIIEIDNKVDIQGLSFAVSECTNGLDEKQIIDGSNWTIWPLR